MATYKHSSELEGNTLGGQDQVYFGKERHDVETRYSGKEGETHFVYHLSGFYVANRYVFDTLMVDRMAFIENILGYEPEAGSFPTVDSLEDLTKVTIALLKEWEKQFGDEKENEISNLATENLGLATRLRECEVEIASLKAELKAERLKNFDPECPTWDNLPFPWLVSFSAFGSFGIYFAMRKDNAEGVYLSDDMTCSITDLILIPRSKWPEMLVNQYIEETETTPNHF
jgi:hypothetical protein